MKGSLRIALLLSIAVLAILPPDTKADSSNNGISMTIYPVVRGADGKQYLITPSGKHVTLPGLLIAQNATQVPVYRDQANHFWYTAMNGQQIAATPEQLEVAQRQINAQSGGGMPTQTMTPPAQSYYSSNPAYANGFNGVPYGTPINMEAPGQYSYMAPGGNKQFVTPSPQFSGQFNQWQQQVPYGQQPMQQGAPKLQGSTHHSMSRMEMRRERRADRLDSRSHNQANNAQNEEDYADSKMESGETLGTGFRARRSAREERRSNRNQRRSDRLYGN